VRIAISTGGGDAPGLNAVIRAVVLSAVHRGWECVGIRRGFGSLLGESELMPLGPQEVRGITHLGGTILGTSNRGNPLNWRVQRPDGSWEERDRTQELLDSFRAHRLDAMVAIGGEGTLGIVLHLWKRGLPAVGVPKTIDNDVGGTVTTFGFDSAVSTATDAIDKLHSTAESHERVMVVEVMGRCAGFIALNSGIAGSADVILIPEIPFDIDKVCDKIRRREADGRHFSMVVVAEGAVPKGGTVSLIDPAHERLGGISEKVAHSIEQMTGERDAVTGARTPAAGWRPDDLRSDAGAAVRRRCGAPGCGASIREDGGVAAAEHRRGVVGGGARNSAARSARFRQHCHCERPRYQFRRLNKDNV